MEPLALLVFGGVVAVGYYVKERFEGPWGQAREWSRVGRKFDLRRAGWTLIGKWSGCHVEVFLDPSTTPRVEIQRVLPERDPLRLERGERCFTGDPQFDGLVHVKGSAERWLPWLDAERRRLLLDLLAEQATFSGHTLTLPLLEHTEASESLKWARAQLDGLLRRPRGLQPLIASDPCFGARAIALVEARRSGLPDALRRASRLVHGHPQLAPIAAGLQGDPDALPSLIELLEAGEHGVAEAAVAAIGEAGAHAEVPRLSALRGGRFDTWAEAAMLAIEARYGEVPSGALSLASEGGEVSVVEGGERPFGEDA